MTEYPKIPIMSSNYTSVSMWYDCLTDKDHTYLSDTFLSRSERLYHAEGASTLFIVVQGGVLSEGYEHVGAGMLLDLSPDQE